MPTQLDQKRLKIGEKASSMGRAKNRNELIGQIETLNDAILAMQSMDDLGSPEANNQADTEMLSLQKRRDALQRKLAKDLK